MNKTQFNDLTYEIKEMLEAYYHNQPFNGYFGISKGHPYTSKLYCSDKSLNHKKIWYFDHLDKGIWIQELKNKLLKWSRCKYSYTYSNDKSIIYDFMFQEAENYGSEYDAMLALDEVMQYHKQLLKEFFCDFVLVYLKNFAKNNPDGFEKLYIDHCKNIANIGLLLNKYDLPWFSFKLGKMHIHNHVPQKLLKKYYQEELSDMPFLL